LGSGGFKRLLAYEYFQAKGKTPAAAKLDDLSRQYIGQALFEGETHPVFFRMGQTDEGFALALGGADWSVIDIDADGWRERPMGSPRFRRSPGMAALPRPAPQGADLECLRPFMNVRNDDDFKLIVGWLLGALRPEGPYPLLILTGE
jgi:putative DNA primase/helicase